MKALLEIEMPKSCTECKLCNVRRRDTDTGGSYKQYICNLVFADVGMFKDERCPECPLKLSDILYQSEKETGIEP